MVRCLLLCFVFLLIASSAFSILCIPQMSGASVYWGGSGTWGFVTGANSYKIYSSTSPEGSFEHIASTLETNWEVFEPTPMTFYRVMASTDNL